MLDRLKSIARRAKHEIKVYTLVFRDKRTPKLARLLLALALVYMLSPIDLIPDFIPVLGHLDDIIIVPALIILATKMVPREVMEDCRLKAAEA